MRKAVKQCNQCGAEIYFDGICVHCRSENERNAVLALSQSEIAAMIDQICTEMKETGQLDANHSLLTKLVNYRDIDTTQIAETASQNGIFYPCIIYKNAPNYVIKQMLDLLLKDDTDSSIAGNLLLCLAAYGGDDVFQAFLELEKNPRIWRKNLYVNPSFYAAYGGWSYDKNGFYREINFNKCYPMVKGSVGERELSPVKIGAKANERCSHCGCQLITLMELDGRDPRLEFLGIGGIIKAKCCPNCLGYSDGIFSRYTLDGSNQLILGKSNCSENYLEADAIDELAANTYVLGDSPVPLRYAAGWEGGSSIGGFAFWIQDCEIKLCPDCGKPMQYLAQIQWDTILNTMEGNAYIEICKYCQVLSILHQQT